MGGGQSLADPQSLAPNFPLQIEDALVVPTGVFQIQADNHFTRTGGTGEAGTTEPVFKIGAAHHLQIDLSPSYNWASRHSPNNGAVTADVLYQLNDNSTFIPAFAVHGYVQQGYGQGGNGTTYILRGIATKYLGSSASAPRLHLNVTWTDISKATAGQRSGLWSAGIGYSQLLTRKTALVMDFIDEQKPQRRQTEQLIDVGLTHQVNADWSVAVGGGAGVAANAPDQRFFFAIERNFQLF